jgi:hypothetical protein
MVGAQMAVAGVQREDVALNCPLTDIGPGDFFYFSSYTLSGLMPPFSSFLFTLLEYYSL